MGTINIAIECHKEHKESVYALATSIVTNKYENSHCNIYVVLSGDEENKYSELLKLKNADIDIIIVDNKEDIPKEVGKVIYIKWNALVMGDLQQMYELDLEGKAIGAVRDLSDEIYSMSETASLYDDTVQIIDIQSEENKQDYKEIPVFYNCCYEEFTNNKNMITNNDYILSQKDEFKLKKSIVIYRLDKKNSPDKYFDGVLSELWMHYYKISPLGAQPIRRRSYVETIGDENIQVDKTIPVLLKAEDKDVPYLVAQIISIVENVSTDRYLDIRIVYRQLSQTHKNMLLELSNHYERMNITLYNNQLLLDANKKGTFELLTSLIFTEYHKAIYIRKSRVCMGNIAEMYDMDIQGYLLAAYERRLETQSEKGTFFNNMPKLDLDAAVVNVDEWNKREICENVYDQMSGSGYSLSDIFGVIYRKEIKPISTNNIWCAKSDTPEEYMELADKYISNSILAERLLKEMAACEERESQNMNKLLERIEKLEKDNVKLKEQNGSLTAQNKEIKAERDRFLYEINETRKSVTYKIGRIITYLPRKIRGER